MPELPFPHDGLAHVVSDERCEVAYYSFNSQKYKRVRLFGLQLWEETVPQAISNDEFYMVIACLEMARVR